jgi:stage V sporulation protein B
VLAVTNSALQACGEVKKPVISMLAGAAVKCASSIFLLKRFRILGAPISTFICYVTVTALNLYFTVKYTGIRLAFGKTLLLPLCGSVLCSLSAITVCSLLSVTAGIKMGCVAGIIVGGVVYCSFILLSGVICREEIALILNRIGKKKGKLNLGDQRT